MSCESCFRIFCPRWFLFEALTPNPRISGLRNPIMVIESGSNGRIEKDLLQT
ncbi:hypothetical protein BDZ94DRAFT_1265971 [Collybia nuda]|uniref:Uncharacterized protein n=1 Tax=Collybia nuda TaxID=64659 RepID=A0A9P5Y1E1_9AGAR|nr:hypothetical protein BDZ94DRAFT_1265971 [Collybia nuda]